MRRASRSIVFFVASGLAACAGALDDPDRFLTDAAVDLCPSGMDVEMEILSMQCGTADCHDDDTPSGGLDLISAGLVSRLNAQTAVGGCSGQPILVSGDPDNSVLYQKTAGTTCGAQMPLGLPALSTEALDCLKGWIIASSTGTSG